MSKIVTEIITEWRLETTHYGYAIHGKTEDGEESLYTVMQPVIHDKYLFVYFSNTYRLKAYYGDEKKAGNDDCRGKGSN